MVLFLVKHKTNKIFRLCFLMAQTHFLEQYLSRLAVTDWYDVMLSNTTAVDAILDRIVHTAYRFELKGDTMRKPKN